MADETRRDVAPKCDCKCCDKNAIDIMLKYFTLSDKAMAIYQCRLNQLQNSMKIGAANNGASIQQCITQMEIISTVTLCTNDSASKEELRNRLDLTKTTLDNLVNSLAEQKAAQFSQSHKDFSFHNCGADQENCTAQQFFES